MKLPYPLVLASASPRRKELLLMLQIPFQVIPSQVEEPLHKHVLTNPVEFVRDLALEKGRDVLQRMTSEAIILSADTVGVIDGEVLEKPKSKADAKRMLKKLSGRAHRVLTGVSIFYPGKKPLTRMVTTTVTFHPLREKDIDHYLRSSEYQDKAAAYAIQGLASVFVKKISGDYFNIVGLPVSTLWSMLKELTEANDEA